MARLVITQTVDVVIELEPETDAVREAEDTIRELKRGGRMEDYGLVTETYQFQVIA